MTDEQLDALAQAAYRAERRYKGYDEYVAIARGVIDAYDAQQQEAKKAKVTQ